MSIASQGQIVRERDWPVSEPFVPMTDATDGPRVPRRSGRHIFTTGGTGTALAAHILATAVELNTRAACRAVIVSALNESALHWWKRLGFEAFAPHGEDSFDQYLLTGDIDATLRRLS